MAAVARVIRFRYALVTAAFLLAALVGDSDDGDLDYFSQAWAVLGHGGRAGGLHLYAVRPDIQIGPVGLAGLWLLDVLCAGRLVFAVVLGALALLLLTVRAVERTALDAGADPDRCGLAVAVGGATLAAAWAVVVPGWGHLEDLAALLGLVLALRAARLGRGASCGACLALALGCKPWAAFGVALLLFLPPWRRVRGALVLAAGVLACWLPFEVAAPSTLRALGAFHLPAIWGSLPYALGDEAAPSWIRPAQLLVATVLIAGCWRLRRPDLTLLCLAVARLVLDAGVFPYYDVELVLGCLLADVMATGRRRSLLGAAAPLTLLSWTGVTLTHDLTLRADQTLLLRCLLYAVLLAGAWAAGRPRRRAAVAFGPRSTRVAAAPTPQPTGGRARAEGGPVGLPRALAADRRYAP